MKQTEGYTEEDCMWKILDGKTVGQLTAEIEEAAIKESLFRIKVAGTWVRYCNLSGRFGADCIPDVVKALSVENVRRQADIYHIIAKNENIDTFRPEREDLVNMLCGVPVSYKIMALLDRIGKANLYFYHGGFEDRSGWNRQAVDALSTDDLLTVYMMIKEGGSKDGV